MQIDNDNLKNLIIEVARKKYGNTEFKRRPLMLAVELEVKERGLWTEDDDQISGSVGIKTKGLANIDWRITNLKNDGRLLNLSRNVWRLP